MGKKFEYEPPIRVRASGVGVQQTSRDTQECPDLRLVPEHGWHGENRAGHASAERPAPMGTREAPVVAPGGGH